MDLPIQRKRCECLSLSLSSIFVLIHQRFPRSMTSNLYKYAHQYWFFQSTFVVMVFLHFVYWLMDLADTKPSWTFPQICISTITKPHLLRKMRLPGSQGWGMFQPLIQHQINVCFKLLDVFFNIQYLYLEEPSKYGQQLHKPVVYLKISQFVFNICVDTTAFSEIHDF